MCRARQPPTESNATGAPSFMFLVFFFISPPSPSLVPITRHECVQMRCKNNCASPFLNLAGAEEGSVCCGCHREGVAIVDRRAQYAEQAGSYLKINHKSSHLGDKEKALTEHISCVASRTPSDRLLL